MGSYATLGVTFKKSFFELCSCKSYIDPILMTVFRELDREYSKWLDEDLEERETFKYSSSVRTIKLRLDIMGFHLTRTINEFNSENDREYYITEYIDDEWNELQFENYTFDVWLSAMRKIVNSEKYYFELKKTISYKEDPSLYYIIEEHENGNSLFGFKCSDIRIMIRGLLELFKEEDEVFIDYSDLVDGGYYAGEDRICELSLQSLAQNYTANERVIVLTEGSSDIMLIKRTMEYLYPDIVDFYSFMDFNQSNASGSASSLVNYIKAFIGSGIRNRVIALFDNDTAANEALIAITKITVPPNIKVLRYPHLEQFNEYPTVGPNGIGFTNINGLACSIEMYLGRDMLATSNDFDYPTKYTPVQWKGYMQALKKYQGEVLNKGLIQKKYLQYLDELDQNPELKNQHDWDGMEAIIRMIFNAFN